MRLPVLALHGFLGSGADWQPVEKHLASSVLAPDLPGHGASVGLADAAYTMDAAADAQVADLDARHLDRVLVAGYSMGGRLALHLTLRHPERVAGLALISASPGLPTDAERAARRQLDAERAEAIRADLKGFLDRWYRAELWGDLPDTLRRQLVERRLNNDPDELAKALLGMGTGVQPWHGDRLREIGVPGVVAVGARDAKYVALAQEMAASSSLRSVIVPDAGHGLLAEAPRAVAHCLTDLLSSLDG
ncbi:MAG: 2-succinyl-6-hydroxy-2,4-cyclohexadiene-1-carboxylate synthase [Rubricoccaceae bacterium]